MPESTAPPRLRVPGAPLTFEARSFSRPRPNGHKRPPSGQRFHLWVSGCQMNESDADYLTQGMTAAGFTAVAHLDHAAIAIPGPRSAPQHAWEQGYRGLFSPDGLKTARPARPRA